MPAGYAPRQFGKSSTDANGNADLSAVSGRTNRHHPAQGHGRARSNSRRRAARHARHHAGDAGQMAFASENTAHDHVSPLVSTAEPGAVGKTESVGRHAPGPGANWAPDQREATQLFQK